MQPDPTNREPSSEVEQLRQQLAHANTELTAVRKEAAGYRTGAKGVLGAAARKLSGALGSPVPDDQDPPDINGLIDQVDLSKHTAAITAKDGEIRALKLRATLSESMHAHGLKPSLTRAVLRDQGHYERLETKVEEPDFEEIVSTTLDELAEQMPEVRGPGSGPIRSSAPMTPTVAHNEQHTLDEVSAMSPEQVTEALHSGRLSRLLGRS